MSELEQIKDEATRLAKNMPWWGWAIGGGVALGGVYYLRKGAVSSGKQGVNAAGAQAEYQPPDGLAMSDLAGLPFDYYDWSSAVSPGGQPGNPNSPGTTGTTGPTATPVVSGPPQVVSGVWNADPSPSPVTGVTQAPSPQPAPSPSPSPSPQPSPVSTPGPQVYTHTVESWPAWDSTLSGIAAHYGMSWQALYNYGNDKSIIDNTAHQHGHYSQEYNWLFPGEVLQVPSPN